MTAPVASFPVTVPRAVTSSGVLPTVHPTGGYDSFYEGPPARYLREGKYHRLDGPAVTWPGESDAEGEWYFDGKRHRDDGPAIFTPGEPREWWVHGELHRVDGPAVEYPDGRTEWHIHDEKITGERLDRLREALDGGAPLEWALAYADGSIS